MENGPEKTFVDAMLMRRMVTMREAIKKGALNPDWVDYMLSHVIDNNHSGDFALRPIWLKLTRPSLVGIGNILEKDSNDHILENEGCFDNRARDLLKEKNWSRGPGTLQLTFATMKNLFISDGRHETEGLIRKVALEQGLQPCPAWVVPSLIVACETGQYDQRINFNICLEDDSHDGALGMFFRKNWHVYRRSFSDTIPWTGNIRWLFVKP
jgi:hypothetical protein